MANYKLITDKNLMIKAIGSIQTRGAKLDRDIQIAALSTMQHSSLHNDPSLLNALIAAMHKGSRVNALREYVESFGNVVFDADSKLMIYKKGKKFDLEGASDVMWTAFKPEQDYQAITDPLALIKGLVAKMERDLKECGTDSKVDPAMVEKLRALNTYEVMH
jgi:hypothetical protein